MQNPLHGVESLECDSDDEEVYRDLENPLHGVESSVCGVPTVGRADESITWS